MDEVWQEHHPSNQMKEYFRIPYIIFGVIKSYKHKITQKRYSEAVREVFGVELSSWQLGQFSKFCKEMKEGGE